MNVIDSTTVKEASATRSAYLKLRTMILTCELPPGEKLKIEKLRSLLDTGASPVREALSLLTSDMLVERIDQRGFRTTPASKDNFEEILMLRCSLESMAIKRSVKNTSAEWVERLVISHHRMKQSVGQNAEEFEQAHKRFHMTLLDNSGSPMLLTYCSQLYDLNIRYRYIAARSSTYQSRDIATEHEDILDAVIKDKAELASERLLKHYRLTGEYLTPKLDDL